MGVVDGKCPSTREDGIVPAAAPNRSTGSFTLGWGLVSIPVSLYSGTEEVGVKRNRYTAVGNPVGMKNYDKVTGEDVEFADIVMRFDVGDGRTVALSDDEIEAIVQPIAGLAEVEAFYPLAHLVAGTYVPETLYQVRPAKVKGSKGSVPNPGAEKAFALLLTAMAAEGVFALVNVTLRGKPKYAALLPDGRFLILKFDGEVREPAPIAAVALSDAEISMGRQLISALKEDTPKVLEDDASAKIVAYALAKAEGTAEAPVVVEAQAPVGDLMAALQASLAAA